MFIYGTIDEVRKALAEAEINGYNYVSYDIHMGVQLYKTVPDIKNSEIPLAFTQAAAGRFKP